MSRSVRKGPYVDPRVLKKLNAVKASGNREPIKTWARACTITPEFIGMTFMVHNGKTFHKVYVSEEMVGHKLGEFSPTRIFRGHARAGSSAEKAAAAAGPAPAAKA